MNVAKKSKGTRNEYLCGVIWILNLLIQGPGEAVLGVLDLETECLFLKKVDSPLGLDN